MANLPRVLIIAGSDPGGGAGIQADIKTVSMLGGYAATAITALTAQNTQGVFGVHPVPPDFIRQQISLVLDDIGADALKTGMLHDTATIEAVAETIAPCKAPLVLDPVMIAKGGAPLLQSDAIEALKTQLLPKAALITPNIPEAEALSGVTINSPEQMREAAQRIAELGPKAVLVKGGHLDSERIIDILYINESFAEFEQPRIASSNTHGTGCTLASAIAAGLAGGMGLPQAVERAQRYVWQAIASAPQIGSGHGPLNHLHPLNL